MLKCVNNKKDNDENYIYNSNNSTFGLVNSMAEEVNPKITSTKQYIDKELLKVQKYADEGLSGKFPRKCAPFSSRLVKYTYPDAPKEIYDYYANAENVCYGKLYAMALQAKLKKEGKIVCEAMEVRLQITHIKRHIEKTNDMPTWNSFMDDYKKICPNNSNTGY